ncbi:hypothetical protein NA56DRAFT_696457 [Hyaloscypha hepaticicola]|uniref:Uncharacterized protein n=1 Tax=Hyaloscypha hepaticicola TaxID=2082293 RepID=A0A2J6QQY8_9HELO|nr:hypothetical protein NA56DRAFT_696457 [Hyaloscypha hepaticicola]
MENKTQGVEFREASTCNRSEDPRCQKLKRSRDEKKETGFFHHGREIRPEKLENFKKRRISKLIEVQSPNTRANIEYRTPSPSPPSFAERISHENELNSRSEGTSIEQSPLISEPAHDDQELIVTTRDSNDGCIVSVSEAQIHSTEADGFGIVTLDAQNVEEILLPVYDFIFDDVLIKSGIENPSLGTHAVSERVFDEWPSHDQFGQARLWTPNVEMDKETHNTEDEEEKNEGEDEDEDGTSRMMSSSISALMSSGVNGAASALGWMGSGMGSMTSKYGLTYSDINLSGISFNYSGLLPKRS